MTLGDQMWNGKMTDSRPTSVVPGVTTSHRASLQGAATSRMQWRDAVHADSFVTTAETFSRNVTTVTKRCNIVIYTVIKNNYLAGCCQAKANSS